MNTTRERSCKGERLENPAATMQGFPREESLFRKTDSKHRALCLGMFVAACLLASTLPTTYKNNARLRELCSPPRRFMSAGLCVLSTTFNCFYISEISFSLSLYLWQRCWQHLGMVQGRDGLDVWPLSLVFLGKAVCGRSSTHIIGNRGILEDDYRRRFRPTGGQGDGNRIQSRQTRGRRRFQCNARGSHRRGSH